MAIIHPLIRCEILKGRLQIGLLHPPPARNFRSVTQPAARCYRGYLSELSSFERIYHKLISSKLELTKSTLN